MHNSALTILISAILLVFPPFYKASAQSVNLSGKVGDKSEFTDDPYDKYGPLVGAVIIIAPTDSTDARIWSAVSGMDGRFHISGIPQGEYLICVSCLGYHEISEHYTLSNKLEYLNFNLSVQSDSIEAARISATVKEFEVLGDTLRYNVAATMEITDDDMLGDVLMGMPGIEYENGTLTIMGRPINKVYINGKLLFGNRPDDALKYLAASQVTTVTAFKEDKDSDKLIGQESVEKETVINVATKEPISAAIIAQAIARYGRNNDENKYSAGASARYFTESEQFEANLLFNNMGQEDNSLDGILDIDKVSPFYRRIGAINLYGRKVFLKDGKEIWQCPSFSASYDYHNERSSKQKKLSREYYDSRHYSESKDEWSDCFAHRASLSFSIPQIALDLQSDFAFSDKKENVFSKYQDISQRLTTEGTEFNSKILGSIQVFSFPESSFFGYMNADFSYGRSLGNKYQSDTTGNTSSVLVSTPDGKHTDGAISMMLSKLLYSGDGSFIVFQTTLGANQNESRRHELKYLNEIDAANLDNLASEDYTFNYKKYSICPTLMGNVGSFVFNTEFPFANASQKKEEQYPTVSDISNNYILFQPHANLSYLKGGITLNLDYKREQQLPSIEQTTEYFNISNPLFIQRGNPDLSTESIHKLALSADIANSNATVWKFWSHLNVYSNQIVTKSTYFQTSCMHEGFPFSAGSTLLSYKNISGGYNWDAGIGMSHINKSLKTGFDYKIGYRQYCNPSFIGQALNYSYGHIPQAELSVKTNYSRRFKQILTYKTNLSLITNSDYQSISYWDNRIVFTSNNNITDRLFINARCSIIRRDFIEGESEMIDNAIVNAIIGYRCFKNKSGEICLSVHDLLNNATSFKTSVLQDYVQTSYNPTIGRFISISFIWQFNSTKRSTGRFTAPSSVNDEKMGTFSR